MPNDDGEVKECRECAGKKLRKKSRTNSYKVDAMTFKVDVVGRECMSCGETYFSNQALQAAELRVAEQLARAGNVSPGSFKFMREALEIRSQDLARLLDVAVETVSRWENEKRDLDRAAWILLATMVLERREGGDTTRARLEGFLKPSPLPNTVRLEAAE